MARAVVLAVVLCALLAAAPGATAAGVGHPVAATAGAAFGGRVATALYCDGCAPSAAAIDWGDGAISQGTLTDAGPPGASSYEISGTHTWAAPGTYTMKITIVRPSPPGPEEVLTTATVAAAPAVTVPAPPAPAPAPQAPSPAPVAPLAAAFRAAPADAGHRAMRFTPAARATPQAGNGLTYEWDFDGRPGSDWACPDTAPVASHTFATAGSRTVTLTVSDGLGHRASERENVTVTPAQANRVATPVSTCAEPRRAGGAGGCVKSFGFGIVEVQSTGRPSDCFALRYREVRTHVGVVASQGSQTTGEVYHASIQGPVRLNGLAIPLGRARSDYDSARASIDLGRARVTVSSFPTQEVALAKTIEPDRTGRYHLLSVKVPGTPRIAGLPVTGGVSIDLLRGRRSETRVDVGLPNAFTFGAGEPAQGALTLRADNRTPPALDGARIGPIPYARLGPVEVRDLFFAYRESARLWEGGATIRLFPGGPGLDASPPPPDQGFGIRDGAFDHAGASFVFPRPYPELLPGIGVSRIGFAIGVHPTRLTGDVGLSVGQGIIDVDGTLLAIFATSQSPYELPSVGAIPGRRLETTMVAATGEARLDVPVVGRLKLADAHVLYEFPDYVEFGAGLHFDGDFGIGSFRLEGGVKGFVAASRRLFNFEGGIRACLDFSVVDACADAGAVVSSRGAAVCAIVPIPYSPVGVPAGVGYVWGASTPDFMLFSCDRGPYREARPDGARTAQAANPSFALPAGLPAAAVRLVGAGGPPAGTLTGPHGERFAIPSTGATAGSAGFAAARDVQKATTQIWLQRPAGGRWTFTPEAGSPPVASVATADGLAPVRIEARVTGRGRHRELRYRVGAEPGLRVTFAERGSRTARVLGDARGSTGTIAFAPGEGAPGRRTIVALAQRGGLPTRSTKVATYVAPATLRPGAPRGLRLTRRGDSVVAHWRAVAGVRRYAVTLRTSIGSRALRVTTAPVARFERVDPHVKVVVGVGAVARDGRIGPRSVASKFRHHRARTG